MDYFLPELPPEGQHPTFPSASEAYDPYGNLAAASGTASTYNMLLFTSKYWDGEAGLGYWGYRWYGPGSGRWLSRDPLEDEYLDSLYGFASNDSVNDVDLLGLFSVKKKVKKVHKLLDAGEKTLWGATVSPALVKREKGKCKWDATSCTCSLSKEDRTYWVVAIAVVGGGKMSETMGGLPVYVTGAGAKYILQHELEHYQVWVTALKGVWPLYEAATGDLTESGPEKECCDALEKGHDDLFTQALTMWNNKVDELEGEASSPSLNCYKVKRKSGLSVKPKEYYECTAP